MVYWSLAPSESDPDDGGDLVPADAADAAEFSISSDGVLSFKFSPDYEMPRGTAFDDTDNTNTYNVVVVASDDPTGAGDMIKMGYKKVTVNVTNVQETETVTLSAQKPQVDVPLTATYNDLDNERPDTATLRWKWHLGGSEIPDPDNDKFTASGLTAGYTPESAGSLKVEASYTRTDGTEKNSVEDDQCSRGTFHC